MKDRYSITLDPTLHLWVKEHFKKDGRSLSAWIEIELMKLSCSANLMKVSGSV